jgi:uncharacterized protein YybS (DUF2232 family)
VKLTTDIFAGCPKEKRTVPQNVPGEIIKDISIGIAITSLLFAITILSPIFGFFCTIFIPLPTLFYRSKLGRVNGVFIPAITIVVMVVMIGDLSMDILYFSELLVIGFALGELFERDLSIEKTIIYTCMVVLLSGFVILLFYSNIAADGLKTLVSDYIRKNLEFTLKLYETMGMSAENGRIFKDSLDSIHYVLIRIVPALVIASTLIVVWATLMLARPLLRAKGFFYPDFGLLNLWKAPEPLVWAVIGAGLMLLIPDRSVKLFGVNGLIILMTVYFFQGIAIVSYYFEKKHLPRLLRFILYSLIALQQIVLLIVIGLGFFDTWLNLRKLKLNKSS